MKQFVVPVPKDLIRGVYVALATACLAFLALHFGQRTAWYKQVLYRELLAGNESERMRAASTLVQLGGQKQLLAAIQADEAGARAVAQKALEYLWFNAAGPKAFALTQDAYRAAEEKRFDDALFLLNHVTRDFPRYAEGWNQRASVLWQMGQYEKSIRDSERALALNPNHYGAWQGMGVCRLKLGEIVEACRCLRAALKIVPYDTPTREALEQCEQLLQKRSPAPERVTGFELI